MKARMTVAEWEQQANRETRGDMVWDILRDYKSAEAECEQLRLDRASLEFLQAGKQDIVELLLAVRERDDGTDYVQGKKDGLRSALALLGIPEMQSLNTRQDAAGG